MSLAVNIKQNDNNRKEIDLIYLEDLLERNHLSYGFRNEIFVMYPYSGENDIRNKYFIIYDNNKLSLGFQFYVNDNYDAEIALSSHATRKDIDQFFAFIIQMCKDLDIQTIYCEDLSIPLNSFEIFKEAYIMENDEFLKAYIQNNKYSFGVFGCKYPIAVEKSFMNKVKGLDDEKLFEEYEKYLDEIQTQDLYYFAKPILLDKKNYMKACYYIYEGKQTALHINKVLPVGFNLELHQKIKEWYVCVINENDDNLELKYVTFDKFNKVMKKRAIRKFDEFHNVYCITKKDIADLDKYIVSVNKYEDMLEQVKDVLVK